MALLDGKVAIVTGAGNGIGRASALGLARAGAKLVVNDNGAERDGSGGDPRVAQAVLEQLHSEGFEAVASDVSIATRDGARSLVDVALKAFGRVDTLLCCAGILRDATLLKVTEQDFAALLQVHLAGSLWCCQAAAEWMRRNGGGSLILSTSSAGLLGNFGQSASAAADAGVYGLMRSASVELQRSGIRVNALAPLAKTRLTQDLPLFEQVETMTPEHVAPLAVFLASDLSKDVTGCVLAVAGGRISVCRMSESAGRFKDDEGGVWTASEIAEHFASIRR
jgi:NAD(P)-dependent dehydrogenase (short-subunit alcohol dehydrogenase family)